MKYSDLFTSFAIGIILEASIFSYSLGKYDQTIIDIGLLCFNLLVLIYSITKKSKINNKGDILNDK